jgi:P-type Cu+ transporter
VLSDSLFSFFLFLLKTLAAAVGSTFNFERPSFIFIQVGLPVAAGALLPVTGTILTPSIAGALMGFSSVGVMANSLFLRVKMDLKHNESTKSLRQENRLNSAPDVILDVTEESERDKAYTTKYGNT